MCVMSACGAVFFSDIYSGHYLESLELFLWPVLSLHDNPHKPGHLPPTQSEINVTLSYGGSDLYSTAHEQLNTLVRESRE